MKQSDPRDRRDDEPDRRDNRSVGEYHERLWVPVGWWLLGGLFALSMLVAVLFYLGPVAAVVTFVLLMAAIAAIFLRYGGAAIRVTDDRLWVGQANIEWRYVAAVEAHDEARTRLRRGPRADARAFMTLRPYLNTAVEVTLDDPEDPTPYWLINSRSPQRLAAAIQARINRPDATPGATLEG
ncbi:DUF3093 domain-containing protein [Microlunatus soli]|uniref:DUF3093 domain-containing protein n=1 Tax=Microlunatus soli TaxID=630515 RepID=A0A1H1M713_9ACTN|nr:DUF3093 domain-containing protein [Microlunatus soli]SDR82571.1 Protein of unknown function [Microlunatus soli]